MQLMIILGFVWIPFIIENWKHSNKIIFKCINCTVRPSFNKNITEFRTYESREQYHETHYFSAKRRN